MKYKQVNRKQSYTIFFVLRKKLYETGVFPNKALRDTLYKSLYTKLFANYKHELQKRKP